MTRYEGWAAVGMMVCSAAIGSVGTLAYIQPNSPMLNNASVAAVVPLPMPRTVEYFIEHQPELKEKIAECNNSPGSFDPECTNATSALFKGSLSNFSARRQ